MQELTKVAPFLGIFGLIIAYLIYYFQKKRIKTHDHGDS